MYKIALLGAGGVGKSCLTIQFVKGLFVSHYDPTIEDSYRKQMTIDGETFALDIFDTAGQEEYSAMTDQYMAQGEGFMLVYSITARASFDRLESYIEQIERAKDDLIQNIPALIIGNKSDLDREREVTTKMGRDLAQKVGCKFFETSALNRSNVEETFLTIAREMQLLRRKKEAAEEKQKKKGKCLVL